MQDAHGNGGFHVAGSVCSVVDHHAYCIVYWVSDLAAVVAATGTRDPYLFVVYLTTF